MRDNAEKVVYDALKRLSATTDPSQIFFRFYYTVAQIAKEAGVSESTARKHLKRLYNTTGYRRRRIHGINGYRYDKED